MAKINLKKILSDSAKAVSEAAETAKKKIDEIDYDTLKENSKNAINKTVEATKKAVQDFDVDKAKQNVTQFANTVAEKTSNVVQSLSTKFEKEESANGMIHPIGAIQLIYLVMIADKEIKIDEQVQFDEIALMMDSNYLTYKEDLLADLGNKRSKLDEEDYAQDLFDLARDIIDATANVKEATIPFKNLIWNLLVVAYSDNEIAQEELNLIKYVSKQLDVDKSLLPELISYIEAMQDVEKEITWLKNTKRTFSEVEEQLKELENRKMVIARGVNAILQEKEDM